MNGGNETDKMKKMITVGGVGQYEEEEVRKEQIRRLIELQTFAGELGDIPSKYARPYMYVYVVASVFVSVRFCCNLLLVITLLHALQGRKPYVPIVLVRAQINPRVIVIMTPRIAPYCA